MNNIYNKLNRRKVSQKEYENVNNTIKEHYKINGNISYYNPNLNMFTNYFNSDIAFNNTNKLIKLLNKKQRISVIGYFYNALIKRYIKCKKLILI